MLPTDPDTGPLFLRLLEIVATLRAPGGCPWDREQTPATIAPYLIEEAHEVFEAVERDVPSELCEELGDVLLEVALLAQMAREKDRFTTADALRSICEKLVRRHPHVFGSSRWEDTDAVREGWARIKAREKGDRGVLDGVPRRLPALHRARRVSEKASGVGFDWSHPLEVLDKVDEELAELKEAVAAGLREDVEEELGDALFALVNLGRHLGIDGEAALHRTTEKFLARFGQVEAALSRRGRHPCDASLEELEALWQNAKTPSGRSPADQAPDEDPPQPGGLRDPEHPAKEEIPPTPSGDEQG